MMDQDELELKALELERKRRDLEWKAKELEGKAEELDGMRDIYYQHLKELEIYKIIAVSAISVMLILAIFGIAIPKHYELEQEKLEFARYQFEVQADQTNISQKLQEANETTKLFEILMNSRLLETAASEFLGAPKGVSNAAKDLAMELIKTLKVNVDCTPRWLCDSRDQKDEKIVTNSSATERRPQNTLAANLWAGNNNKENICFACRYMNLETGRNPG